ncbi:hypothetical protein [Cupriavidus campinensis]|uniref:Uncharacterized protein n=1 Tax=Cupriavidus campinensis TaxID=151783 RepID=A0ABY3ESP9_9BURK|nr:hypothetical protein [Cupriavidus campinensis]TSP13925.1 hypothetical protein FGG12_05465 [Cupriavidus campinensis]
MNKLLQSTTIAARPKLRRRPVPLHMIDFRAHDELDDLQEALEVEALRSQVRSARSIQVDQITLLQ